MAETQADAEAKITTTWEEVQEVFSDEWNSDNIRIFQKQENLAQTLKMSLLLDLLKELPAYTLDVALFNLEVGERQVSGHPNLVLPHSSFPCTSLDLSKRSTNADFVTYVAIASDEIKEAKTNQRYRRNHRTWGIISYVASSVRPEDHFPIDTKWKERLQMQKNLPNPVPPSDEENVHRFVYLELPAMLEQMLILQRRVREENFSSIILLDFSYPHNGKGKPLNAAKPLSMVDRRHLSSKDHHYYADYLLPEYEKYYGVAVGLMAVQKKAGELEWGRDLPKAKKRKLVMNYLNDESGEEDLLEIPIVSKKVPAPKKGPPLPKFPRQSKKDLSKPLKLWKKETSKLLQNIPIVPTTGITNGIAVVKEELEDDFVEEVNLGDASMEEDHHSTSPLLQIDDRQDDGQTEVEIIEPTGWKAPSILRKQSLRNYASTEVVRKKEDSVSASVTSVVIGPLDGQEPARQVLSSQEKAINKRGTTSKKLSPSPKGKAEVGVEEQQRPSPNSSPGKTESGATSIPLPSWGPSTFAMSKPMWCNIFEIPSHASLPDGVTLSSYAESVAMAVRLVLSSKSVRTEVREMLNKYARCPETNAAVSATLLQNVAQKWPASKPKGLMETTTHDTSEKK